MASLWSMVIILAMAAGCLAATLPTGTGKGLTSKPSKGVLVDAPLPSPPAIRARQIGPGPQYLTITVINSHTNAISTAHNSDPHGPAPTDLSQVKPGIIAAGGTASFAVPTGWIGNVAVVDARYRLSNSDTLIESNYVIPQGGYTYAVADVDISHVNGFTMAMTCSCHGRVVTGCNKDLHKLATCPQRDGPIACMNPLRAVKEATAAAPFFAPCQGAAWTFVNDGGADAWGMCQSGQIVCCAGTACPPNPKQPAGPNSQSGNNNNVPAPPALPASGKKEADGKNINNGPAPPPLPADGKKKDDGGSNSSSGSTTTSTAPLVLLATGKKENDGCNSNGAAPLVLPAPGKKEDDGHNNNGTNNANSHSSSNGTAPSALPASGKQEDDSATFVGAAAITQSSSAAAVPAASIIGLPGLASLSLPALPFSFSLPAFPSLSLPAVLKPTATATRPAVPALSLSLPAGVNLPPALQPAPTTASRA